MDDLRIFLSYNVSRSDMVVLWRLQTLAAAHGIALFIPHPQDRRGDRVSGRVAQMIQSSMLVVVLCTQPELGQRVKREVEYAVQIGKPVLFVLEKRVTLPREWEALPTIRFDPRRDPPGQLEQRVIDHLVKQGKRFGLGKKQASALGLLLGIGMALLVLYLLTKE